MKVCPNCNINIDDNVAFCPNCGTSVANSAPQQAQSQQPYQQQYQQPYQQPYQYSYQQPYQPQQQNPSGGSVALKTVGLILSIIGLVMASFSILYCLAESDPSWLYEEDYIFTNMFLFFSTFPFSLVGLILSAKSKIGNLGKIFGIIGVSMAGLQFILTFLLLDL